MVWETNYWAFLETNKKWIPSNWVKVQDHDDTMIIKLPTELYINTLKWDKIEYFNELLIDINGFHPSSISYTINENTFDELLICRMINYTLSEDGRQYIYSGNERIIENINILINLTNKTSHILLHNDTNTNKYINCFSNGLEDIRLYPDMTFSANSVSFTNGIVPQIIYGKINIETGYINDIKHIKSPQNTDKCEKNWIFISHNNNKYIIYRWFPFDIGVLKNDEIKIISSINLTPEYIFKNMRGSTPFIHYSVNKSGCNYNGNWLIGVVHYSIDQSQDSNIVRKYYHCLVLLNPNTFIPYIITSPFTFSTNHGIEFCIGMKYDKGNGVFIFWVSIMDNNPMVFYIKEENIDFNILISNTKNIL
jgi:hypothetical protein